MWPFKNRNDVVPMALSANELDDVRSILDVVKSDGINKAIEAEVKKSFSLTDFQNYNDSDGGHFGQEFHLRPTIARIKGLHASEPWVYATSSILARTMASVPFIIVDANDETKELPNHPANAIVNGGNATQDLIHKKWTGNLDLTLAGNYWEITDENYTMSMQVPAELAEPVLRKADTTADWEIIQQLGPFEFLDIFEAGMGKATRRIPWEHVIHHKYPNPYNPYFGLSMYVAASRPILLDRHKNEFEMAFYLRGAMNAGVIETTDDITKSRMERLMRTFEQTFTGRRNWWRTIFLPKGAKWVGSGLTMKEMEHLEGLRENRLTLLAVLGVPPSQLGIVQDVNRATAETQEAMMWQNSIIPLTSFLASGYNNSHLFREVYKGEVKAFPDYSGIDAVEGSLITRAERAKSVDNIATINEQRDIVQLERLPDSDPRGNMTLAELKKYDPTATVENPDGDGSKATGGGMTENVGVSSTGTVAAEVGPSSDDTTHTHVAEFDSETGIGKTVKTMGDDDHTHRIRPDGDNTELLIVEPTTDDGHTHPPIDRGPDDAKLMAVSRAKKNATTNQSRIEKTQTSKFLSVLDKNTDMALTTARTALLNGRNVKNVLEVAYSERLDEYKSTGLNILADSMERGWDMSMAQTRSFNNAFRRNVKQSDKISAEDEQALNAIRERTADGRRARLDERNISSFQGFDENQTEQIMKLIEEGQRDGKTMEEIAATIRKDYGERYPDQAFTIARTETLTAVSAGIKANHDALNEVYSEVNKQWFHVGDIGSNPDARKGHAQFETHGKDGVVPSDYVWVNEITGARLSFPRDPKGGAGDVINCRCTMVSVIPDDATSNASDILG